MPDSEHSRDGERVPSDLHLEFRVPSSQKKGTGEVRNLSSTGALFLTYEKLTPGMKIHIRIPFVNDKTPPLMALAEVVRSRTMAGGEGYMVACMFD